VRVRIRYDVAGSYLNGEHLTSGIYPWRLLKESMTPPSTTMGVCTSAIMKKSPNRHLPGPFNIAQSFLLFAKSSSGFHSTVDYETGENTAGSFAEIGSKPDL